MSSRAAVPLIADWQQAPRTPQGPGYSTFDDYDEVTGQVGAQIKPWYDNVPPRGGFVKETLVSSMSAMEAALDVAVPGEAVIVQNGTYTETALFQLVVTNTDDDNPVYLLAETPLGVTITGGTMAWQLGTGANPTSNLVIGGFRWVREGVNATRSRSIYNVGASNRYRVTACEFIAGTDTGAAIYNPGSTWYEIEVDNCIFDGDGRDDTFSVIGFNCPDPRTQANTPKHVRVHHCTFKNRAYDGVGSADVETIKLGSGYNYIDEGPNASPDGNDLYYIIENNLFDSWDGEEELITVKAGTGLIRNNHCKNSPWSVIVVRQGDRCHQHSNWMAGKRAGNRISGRSCYFTFNYLENDNAADLGVRLHRGGDDGTVYDYPPATGSRVECNVWNRCNQLVQYRTGFGSNSTEATGMTIVNNDVYGDGIDQTDSQHYSDESGAVDYATFTANNATWTNTTYNTTALAQTPTPTAGLFVGPGGDIAGPHPEVYGQPTVIKMPSWWK